MNHKSLFPPPAPAVLWWTRRCCPAVPPPSHRSRMSPPGPISLHISGVLLLLSLRCLGTGCLPAHVLCLTPRVFLEQAQLSRVRCCHEPPLQHHRYVCGCPSVLNACSQGPCPEPCRLSTPNVSRDLPEHPDQCCSSACKRVSRKMQGHPSARTASLLLFERLQGMVRGRFQGGLRTQQCRSVLLGAAPVP